MTQKIIALLVAGGVIGCAASGAIAQTSVENATTAESARADRGVPAADLTPLSISVRQTEAATVVYSEYTGPYWGVGPVLRRVHADMMAANIRGATFIRFPNDPRAAPSVPAATFVGYFAEPGARPNGTYVVEHWKPVLVVATTVRGSNTRTNALYPRMRAWATANGYAVIGPIIEVFEPLPAGAPVDDQRTEIRMPVRPLSEPGVATVQPDTSNPRAPAASVVESSPTDLVAQRAARQTEASVSVPTRRPPAGGVVPPVDESADRAASEPAADPAVSQAHTFEALIDRGRYDEAVVAMWPRGTRLDRESLGWLDQIASRVRAMATAFADQDTEGARRIGALANALTVGLSRVSDDAGSTGGSLARPTRAARVQTDSSGARDILQAYDRLMVRIGQGSVDATQCLADLHRLLVRVDRIVHEPSQK